ncbi:MAG: 5'-methylthioadenosine/adenosylhomocysteine nucleosidase [bacterium]|nr:5'-methylthioadenosine/adenosylhomocysteine nucleosidase [bacterium]
MFNNKTIAVIGAMDCETELIKDFLTDVENVASSCFDICLGKAGKNIIIIAKSGVGKVAASCCTQYIINEFEPDFIINTGVAGGVGKGLNIGDIVIAESFIQHDFDASALGYAKGYICNGIENQKPTVFYSDKKLVEKMETAALKTLSKESVHIGRIVSGDTFVATVEKKAELKKLFNATAAEMESAAIAHSCSLNNIPCVAIRAISDLADGTKIENYPEFEIKTAQISAQIIKNLLSK